MSSADESRVARKSQAAGTDLHRADWKRHRVRVGSHQWEGDLPPEDPSVHRKHIEPWLAALLQAEHVSLLVGSGLTSESLGALAGLFDGAIVGSAAKRDGRATEPVLLSRARALVAARDARLAEPIP